jgi:transposase
MRKEGDPLLLEQQRFNAARMFDQGIEPNVIAASLGFDDQTVRRWLRTYHAGGMEALAAKIHPGPKPRLNDEQKQEFIALIEQPPDAYVAEGLAGRLWTAAKMATLIKRRFGVNYHPSHVGQMMHDLDYTQQLPHKRPRERDAARIQQWRNEHWPQIVQRARKSAATIVFADEAGFLMDPLRKKIWAPRGQTPELLHRTRHRQKLSVIGGLTVDANGKKVGLFTQWHPDQSIDQHAVVQFLSHLLKELRGNVIVVWDNLQAHRSKLVKAMCSAQRGRLWLEALPGYAPDLNPIELVWCMSKYHRLANHGIGDLEQLHQAAQEAIDEIKSEKDLLRNCIRNAGLADALYPDGDQ